MSRGAAPGDGGQPFALLRGEEQRCFVVNVWALGTGEACGWRRGVLHVTNFRLVFTQEPEAAPLHTSCTSSVSATSAASGVTWQVPGSTVVPLLALQSVEREDNWGGTLPCRLSVVTKDVRRVVLAFKPQDSSVDMVHDWLREHVSAKEPLQPTAEWARGHFFCFAHVDARAPDAPEVQPGWDVYSPEAEFARQGALQGGWRLSQVNASHQLCPSYPEVLCVPDSIGDSVISAAAAYRHRNRMPILSYYHRATRAALCRCAQPQRGILGARNECDEQLVRAIAREGKMEIVDLRPRQNAAANRAVRGGGSEEPSHYSASGFRFAPIENIHKMRESAAALRALCLPTADALESGCQQDPSAGRWLAALQETQWLEHIRRLLEAAQSTAAALLAGMSVLLHCSDGWDRTAQVVSLVQVLCDPHARTVQGFCALCEREWVQCGHNFRSRLGHCRGGSDACTGPIFLQFLDAVHQLLAQLPAAFEFTSELLLRLADAAHSGLYGTFAADSPAEITQWQMRRCTASAWAPLLGDAALRSPLYSRVDGPLPVDARPQVLRLWRAFWLRECPAACALEHAAAAAAGAAALRASAAEAEAALFRAEQQKWAAVASRLAARVAVQERRLLRSDAQKKRLTTSDSWLVLDQEGQRLQPSESDTDSPSSAELQSAAQTGSGESEADRLAAQLVARAAVSVTPEDEDTEGATGRLLRDRARLMEEVAELKEQLRSARSGLQRRQLAAQLAGGASKGDRYRQRIAQLAAPRREGSGSPVRAVPGAEEEDPFADFDRSMREEALLDHGGSQPWALSAASYPTAQPVSPDCSEMLQQRLFDEAAHPPGRTASAGSPAPGSAPQSPGTGDTFFGDGE
eukprot:TRINITY_DN18880_c0_g1_i1.p1 TRINITY_DN18880_c0_g1~~TRINITY_DN18880_c0_g1_i1.p1  ORF type:complete len:861 (+),score=190.92 TRINITY_DN18880_c0_g1_i1:92-2674(+)